MQFCALSLLLFIFSPLSLLVSFLLVWRSKTFYSFWDFSRSLEYWKPPSPSRDWFLFPLFLLLGAQSVKRFACLANMRTWVWALEPMSVLCTCSQNEVDPRGLQASPLGELQVSESTSRTALETVLWPPHVHICTYINIYIHRTKTIFSSYIHN